MKCTCPNCGHQFTATKRQTPKPEAPSERGIAFANWFHSQLPPGTKPTEGWQTKWAQIFDAMIRLDGRTEEQIARVCKAARAHTFWSQQFLSPAKLRQRDKSGVQYFDKFAQLTNHSTPRSVAAAQDGRHYQEPARELPEE